MKSIEVEEEDLHPAHIPIADIEEEDIMIHLHLVKEEEEDDKIRIIS